MCYTKWCLLELILHLAPRLVTVTCVEFVGPPGAGKSWLHRESAKHARTDGVVLMADEIQNRVLRQFGQNNVARTILRLLPVIARRPLLSVRVVAALIPFTMSTFALRRALRRSSTIIQRVWFIARTSEMQSQDVLIFPDEWVLHELVVGRIESRRSYSASLGRLASALTSGQRSRTQIVSVATSVAECARRVAARETASYFDALPSAEVEEVVHSYAQLEQQILAALARRNVPVLHVAASVDGVRTLIDRFGWDRR